MTKLDLDIHQNIINIIQMNKEQKYKELKQFISEKRKELKIRKERLHYNIFAGVSKNSINIQKDEISKLES